MDLLFVVRIVHRVWSRVTEILFPDLIIPSHPLIMVFLFLVILALPLLLFLLLLHFIFLLHFRIRHNLFHNSFVRETLEFHLLLLIIVLHCVVQDICPCLPFSILASLFFKDVFIAYKKISIIKVAKLVDKLVHLFLIPKFLCFICFSLLFNNILESQTYRVTIEWIVLHVMQLM